MVFADWTQETLSTDLKLLIGFLGVALSKKEAYLIQIVKACVMHTELYYVWIAQKI